MAVAVVGAVPHHLIDEVVVVEGVEAEVKMHWA